jgi:hypothetical protein
MTNDPVGPQEGASEQRKGKKPSSAASNVAQAKAKMKQDGKIGSLAQSRAELSKDPKTGEPTLTAVFPRKGGREPHHVDMSFLLAFPNLRPMFMDAFLFWGANLEPNTRNECRVSLRLYFFAYLRSDWSDTLRPEDIDDELLTGFRDSLMNKSGRRDKALHPTTVTKTLGTLRKVLASLALGPWAVHAGRISELVPSGPAGASRKSTPIDILGLARLLAILEAAEKEVLATEHRFAEGRALLAEGRTRLRDSSRVTTHTCRDYGEISVCLAAVDEAYPGVIPDLPVLIASHPTLGKAVREIHGQGRVVSYFYPCGRDLVPFVLLLAVATVFNPDTLLILNWADIDFNKDHAGRPAIEIVGAKGRASSDLLRLLDPEAAVSSGLSLKQMFESLGNITARLRKYLAPAHADRLFVFVQKNCAKRPKSFGEDGEKCGTPSADQVWRFALNNFIKDNGLSHFTLGQLRPSILDLVQLMDGGLETARKIGNHGSPATTWTHYTSGGVRARYRERIGQVIVLRERWLETKGVIDPRRLAPGQDKGAATPGFSCLDPFDSQRPNQQPGKLCKDYGGCPSCPMAAAHPGDPLCVAYYIALEVAIYRSQGTMTAQTWVERWTPVLADLAALRAWIPPEVLEASREISIRLPNVG